jgi:uncharacterized repeat protein (TIGR03803 family)
MHYKQRFPSAMFHAALRPDSALLATLLTLLFLLFLFLFLTLTAPPAQAQTYKVIYSFTGGQDGANPEAGVTLGGTGTLYGTTYGGGAAGVGTVYQLKQKGSNWIFSPLYSFGGNSDGAHPLARVIIHPYSGVLFGTTYSGGSSYFGTVFQLAPPASACRTALCPWTETVLYSFTGPDGGRPGYGDLSMDPDYYQLYGTTILGNGGYGVVYEVKDIVLYRFSGSDGANPYGGLFPVWALDESPSYLYGTTYGGGLSNFGTVFELTRQGSGYTEQVLYNFTGGSDGSYPVAGPIFGGGGMYGSTTNGGSGGGGTVFELTPSGGGWTCSLLYSFTGGAGCGPGGPLVMDAAGNLYGATLCDGANNLGSVFKLTPSGNSWTYTSLHDFTGGNDGARPYGNVVFDANGNLYGTAASGGSHGDGVVWEITP